MIWTWMNLGNIFMMSIMGHPTTLANSAGSRMLVSLAQDASEYFFGGEFLVE